VRRAFFLAVLASFAACTYEVDVEHAVKDLNLGLVYAPCGPDAGAPDARKD
jgi:hypothetical protein